MAGSWSTVRAVPAWPGSGPPATWWTPEPRSSPPLVPAPPPPSRSTPTWLTTTSATPSTTSTTASRLPQPQPPTRRRHDEQPHPDHPQRAVRQRPGTQGTWPADAAPARPDDLAGGLPNADHPEPGARRLAAHPASGRAH